MQLAAAHAKVSPSLQLNNHAFYRLGPVILQQSVSEAYMELMYMCCVTESDRVCGGSSKQQGTDGSGGCCLT